jgi:hypothetical protein
MSEKRKIVVLCGSSRFVQEMAVAAWLLERDEGAITMGLHLLPYWYGDIPDHLAEHEGVADKLDNLHLDKLAAAATLAQQFPGTWGPAEVFVVDRHDYIGESTIREIERAKKFGMPIRYYSNDPIGKKVEVLRFRSQEELCSWRNQI